MTCPHSHHAAGDANPPLRHSDTAPRSAIPTKEPHGHAETTAPTQRHGGTGLIGLREQAAAAALRHPGSRSRAGAVRAITTLILSRGRSGGEG